MKSKVIGVILVSLLPVVCSAKEPHELIVGKWVLVGHHCDMASGKCQPVAATGPRWEEEFKADGSHFIAGDPQADKYSHKYQLGKDSLTITTYKKPTGRYVTTLKAKLFSLDEKFLFREQFGETYILKMQKQ